MNVKLVSGLVGLIAGLILILFSVHSMNRIASAKKDIGLFSSMTGSSSNPFVGAGKDKLNREASQYDTEVQILLVAGIALLIVGGAVTVIALKKKKK